MEKKEILKRIQEIFIEILDNDSIELAENTTANDIDEWDSLSHVQIIIAIQKELNVKFTAAEMSMFKNIDEMINCIISKLNG